ncbi:Uncharacterized protein TCM_031461 [Theobroma cacao]|uniref:Uncharacterized protein n=1 Tax=Theobroma cacao TaxID=3641 RepID=A0A061F7C7_THECC|nr:Uncharacterized protein TCM_031461 [Theobroma cacao]
MSQISIIKHPVSKLMELLNENGITCNDGKASTTPNNNQSKPSLINSTFSGIVSNHLCFNTSNYMPYCFNHISNIMIKQDSWIIDSGSSDHICHSLDRFAIAHPVSNHYVHLPNNGKALVTHIGPAIMDSDWGC